jgi:hypothetical protein
MRAGGVFLPKEHSEAEQLMSSKYSWRLRAHASRYFRGESLPLNGLRAASKGKPGAAHDL